jgi:16S rRNA (uracil1498-N3)-methyltransferase
VSDPLFLLDELADPLPALGATVELGGPEGRHASVVRRVRPGESMLIGDGRGRGVRGEVLAASKAGLVVRVIEQLIARVPAVRYVAVLALAKAARDELAVEMLTELGVQEIVPWQAQRSVVRWAGDRTRSGLARWRSTVREAAKQSRRLHVPVVRELVRTVELARLVAQVDLALVLHEGAAHSLRDVELPQHGTIMIVIGPEGGIAAAELDTLAASGGRPVLVSDGVLRTSTAGVVALAGLLFR